MMDKLNDGNIALGNDLLHEIRRAYLKRYQISQ